MCVHKSIKCKDVQGLPQLASGLGAEAEKMEPALPRVTAVVFPLANRRLPRDRLLRQGLGLRRWNELCLRLDHLTLGWIIYHF